MTITLAFPLNGVTPKLLGRGETFTVFFTWQFPWTSPMPLVAAPESILQTSDNLLFWPGHMLRPAEYFIREMKELSKRAGLHWDNIDINLVLLLLAIPSKCDNSIHRAKAGEAKELGSQQGSARLGQPGSKFFCNQWYHRIELSCIKSFRILVNPRITSLILIKKKTRKVWNGICRSF